MKFLLSLALVLTCALVASAQDANVNLSLFQWGGMPSALSSEPNMACSAGKVADGRLDTGWVSGAGGLPVWLEMRWRIPVEVREVAFRQWSGCPVKGAGGVGRFTVEARAGGKWVRVAAGDASATPADGETRVRLEQSATAGAVRLVVESAPAGQVAVSELQVLGPKPDLPFDWLPAWKARYIWTEPSLVMPNRQPVRRYLRKAFTVANPADVREAWLAACAFDRLNTLWLNNTPVLTDISYNGSLLRQAKTRSIPTNLLRQGENVIAASVDDIYECGSMGLLAELVLMGKDGARTVIATDPTWKGNEDQGESPLWRKPGFNDARWAACSAPAGPNGGWHWLWGVPYPTLAPQETLKVVGMRLDPPVPRPGTEAECRLTFECAAKPRADYAVVLRLGQHSYSTDHDYELFGAVLRPEQVRTGGWEAGRHEVALRLRIPEEAPRNTPATLLVSLPSGAAGLETALPGCRADAYGLHFTLPVDRGADAATRTGLLDDRKSKIENRKSPPGFPLNEIRTLNGTPTMHIDGRPVSPILWSSAYGNYRRYDAYAKTGVKLFRPLIAGSPICAPGEEKEYYPWWFAQIDRMIEAAISVDPEIRVLPALFMDPNPEVLFENPGEQMVSGRGMIAIPNLISHPDKSQVRPTFMSQEWRRLGAEGLKRLVEHMKRQPYAPNVVGLWFFAGRGGENYYGCNELNLFINEAGGYDARPREAWDAGEFSPAARQVFREFLVRKYATDAALQQAWQRKGIRFDDILSPARFRREEVCDILVGAGRPANAGVVRNPVEPGVGALPMDYYQCLSEAMVDTFAAWGRAVKEASGNRLLTGCYYGYTLGHLITNLPGHYGHTAVARACETPYLDFYCSPTLYEEDTRRAGGSFWAFNIIDSLRLHNKLWIYEQDTRTYLADIGPKSYSQAETISVLQRDCAAALTHSVGWWWYEFATGQRGANAREWFEDPEIARFAGQIRRVYDHSLTLPDRGPAAQIAVFYHGETHTAQEIFPAVSLNLPIGRLTLFDGVQRIGAPYDIYNLADIPRLARTGRLAQYKMCLFLNPFYLTAGERQSLELCKGGGRTLVWLWAPGLAQAGAPLSAERVSAVTGIPGIRILKQNAEPVCRITAGHPLLAGLPAGLQLAPKAFEPGHMWERYGNKICPLPYVDPKAAGADTRVLGRWVIDGKQRDEMGAFCVREFAPAGKRQWASVYSAVPYLSPELMRAIARWAGVHIYRDSNDVLFADRRFVAVHTGAKPATDLLRLPAKTAVYDVFAGKAVAANADSMRLNVPAYSTALYYLGDPGPFRAAVEGGQK